MSLVLDASLTIAWYFEDERTPATEAVLDQVGTSGALVPSLWKLEVANGFQMAIRRGRIDAGYREHALSQLSALPIEFDDQTLEHAWSASLRISDRFGLTIYDAAYLELAERRRLPLATLDRALREAAASSDVETIGFGS